MRRRDFIALLATGVAGLVLPRICPAQNHQYQYYEGQVPDNAYEDGSFKWGKHIWIWQYDQVGEAIEDGKIVFRFRIISGLAGTNLATPEGDYRIFRKGGWWHNGMGNTEMPLPMYFLPRRALHGWSRTEPFPPVDEAVTVASHSCISVDKIVELYNWTPIGTPVHIRSQRIGYW